MFAEHPAAASTPYASAGSTDIVPEDTTTYSPRGNTHHGAQFSDASDAATPRPVQTPYESDGQSAYTAGHASQDLAGISSYDTSVAHDMYLPFV